MSYPPGQQAYASGGQGYPAQGQVYSSGGMSYPLGSQGYPNSGRMGVVQGYTQPTAQGIYTSAVGTGVPAAGNPGYPSAPSPQYVPSPNQQGYTTWADLGNAAGTNSLQTIFIWAGTKGRKGLVTCSFRTLLDRSH